jgi:hypothetical protein
MSFMSEISDFFESLYSNFILRDILAKVLPGLIGLVSLVILFVPKSLHLLRHVFTNLDLLSIVIIYGISFMFGMLIQFLGMLTPFIVIYVWKDDSRWLTREKSLSKAVEFQKAASKDCNLLRQRERFAVLKEMASNYSVAVFLIFIAVIRVVIFPVSGYRPQAIPISILCITIVIILIFQNRMHAIEQKIWEEQVIEQYSKKDEVNNNSAG